MGHHRREDTGIARLTRVAWDEAEPSRAEDIRDTVWRWAPAPWALAALLVTVVVVAVAAGLARAASLDPPEPSASNEASASAPVQTPTSLTPAGKTGGDLVVHVVGAVGRPGLVTLPSGSRVADAIEAAGGASTDAHVAALNLARLLADGEQIVVPREGEEPEAGGPSGVSSEDTVDLNRADAAALQQLPGIGPALAERIVDYRREHGPFGSVDELANVPGIGAKTLARFASKVRV